MLAGLVFSRLFTSTALCENAVNDAEAANYMQLLCTDARHRLRWESMVGVVGSSRARDNGSQTLDPMVDLHIWALIRTAQRRLGAGNDLPQEFYENPMISHLRPGQAILARGCVLWPLLKLLARNLASGMKISSSAFGWTRTHWRVCGDHF